LVNLLTGRSLYSSVKSSASLDNPLHSDEHSNVLLYLSGHGGDGFFKAHDAQELSAEHLALSLDEMRRRGRYRNLLVVADTCACTQLK
jgi:phosphatidylinositol glycan class K